MDSTGPDREGRGDRPAGVYRLSHAAGDRFDPAQTALLVIDPVNDFLSEGGAAWDLTKGTVTRNDVVANLRRAIDGSRERGIPVLFGPMAYTREDYADERLQRRSGINRVMFERRMFLAGSWGADFHPDLTPAADDVVLMPHKGMDVFETDLPDHLGRLGTTQLVIAGMTANLCCESTGRHAMEHGYDVTYLADAIGAESLPAYEASIHLNFPLIANAVMDVECYLGAIGPFGGELPKEGDTIVGSDGGEIGTVERVVPGDAETEGHLFVSRGLIFSHDTYIPIDAVVKRTGRQAVINVPKLVVGKMPWGEPPTKRRDLLGPPAETVAHLYGSRSPSGAP